MEPKPVYNTPPTNQRAAPARTATVTLSVDVLRVVYALQMARNQGHDEVLVRLRDWRVVGDLDISRG